MRHLLDTNILADLIRHPQGRICERIAEVGTSTMTHRQAPLVPMRLARKNRVGMRRILTDAGRCMVLGPSRRLTLNAGSRP